MRTRAIRENFADVPVVEAASSSTSLSETISMHVDSDINQQPNDLALPSTIIDENGFTCALVAGVCTVTSVTAKRT